jgi:hypothetical protein
MRKDHANVPYTIAAGGRCQGVHGDVAGLSVVCSKYVVRGTRLAVLAMTASESTMFVFCSDAVGEFNQSI